VRVVAALETRAELVAREGLVVVGEAKETKGGFGSQVGPDQGQQDGGGERGGRGSGQIQSEAFGEAAIYF
jgi:hypothetical protein